MRITGERRIGAPRREVWEALRDPDTIRQALPACVRYEAETAGVAAVALAPRIGPVKAEIAGKVRAGLSSAPERFQLVAESAQGPAGLARGTADVRLLEADRATIVRYEIDAQVGGKLAQLGPSVVEAAARRMAEEFGENLDRLMAERQRPRMRNEALYPYESGEPSRPEAVSAGAPAGQAAGSAAIAARAAPSRPWLWGVAAFALVLVLLISFS